jgi:hypothetical protein
MWAVSGFIIGSMWFVFNDSLPAIFRGRDCCDSVNYISIAKSHANLGEMLNFSGDRALGYPLFLKLHQVGVEFFKLPVDWINASCISSLILHFAAILFFYWILTSKLKFKLHPFFLLLVLIHPGLVSHAALSLSDSVTTSLFTLSLAFTICAFKQPQSHLSWRTHLVAGALLGLSVLMRPLLLSFVLVAFPLIWVFYPATNEIKYLGRAKGSKKNVMRHFALPFLLGFALTSGVGFRSCFLQFHRFCLSNPSFNKEVMAGSIRVGLRSSRVYTSVTPATKWAVVTDAYSQRHFGDKCIISDKKAISTLLQCYIQNLPALPLHLLKKMIGFFDNYQLNTYAVDITTTWERYLNRTFGLLGFLGTLCAFLYLYLFSRGQKYRESSLVLLTAFILIYTGISLNFHIESRYGFPAVPAAIFLLGIKIQEELEKKNSIRAWAKSPFLWLMVTGSAVFWLQTWLWDRLKDSA